MMSVHLEITLQKIKNSLLTLAAIVEVQVKDAVDAFYNSDLEAAKTIINKDNVIDQTEIDIEESCLQCLALYQPVAQDLRFIIAVLKINNDLERIGDLSVSIAERTLALSKASFPVDTLDYRLMSKKALEMLRHSIESFISGDTKLARKVRLADTEIDKIHQNNYKIIENAVEKNDNKYSSTAILQLMSISRYIERVADLATNIAEDVVYLVEGKILRHQAME